MYEVLRTVHFNEGRKLKTKTLVWRRLPGDWKKITIGELMEIVKDEFPNIPREKLELAVDDECITLMNKVW